MRPDPEIIGKIAEVVHPFFEHAASVAATDVVIRASWEARDGQPFSISSSYPVFAYFRTFACEISIFSKKEKGEIGAEWVVGELQERLVVPVDRFQDLVPIVEVFRKDGPSLFASELYRSLSYLLEIGVPGESMALMVSDMVTASVMES